MLIIDLQTLNWIAFAPLVVYWGFDCVFICTTVEYPNLVSMKQSHHKLRKCGEMFRKKRNALPFVVKSPFSLTRTDGTHDEKSKVKTKVQAKVQN